MIRGGRRNLSDPSALPPERAGRCSGAMGEAMMSEYKFHALGGVALIAIMIIALVYALGFTPGT